MLRSLNTVGRAPLAGVVSTDEAESLLAAAREGDGLALGTLLSRLRPLLFHVARQHATPGLEADDLVATASLSFVEALDRGAGPTANPGAYLTASIRNLAIDFKRSREARNMSLGSVDPNGSIVALDAPQDALSVELMIERELVSQAFEQLPERHRRVLQDLVIDGQKPAQLVEEYGQAANTISAQASRARKALGMQLRKVLLERTPDADCRKYKDELARLGNAETQAAKQHLAQCKPCTRALAAFQAIPGVLSLLPFVGVVGVAGASAAGDRVADPVPSADKRHSSVRKAAIGATSRRWYSRAALVSVGLVLVVAGIFVGKSVLPGLAHESTGDAERVRNATSADPIAIAAEIAEHEGQTHLQVKLAARNDVTAPIQVALTIPDSMYVSDAPRGWSCSRDSGGGSCVIDAPSTAGALIIKTTDGTPSFGDFSLAATATVGELEATGTVDGTIVVR